MVGAMRGLFDRASETVTAVDAVSFDVARGEIVGYIGPNGAGKSTTIKMLTGVLTPSSGEATVAGFTPWSERRKLAQQIGVVFGQRTQLWWDLPLIESLELLQHVYRVPEQRFRENFTMAAELLELGSFLNTPVRQLSLGQRMRGDLAAALLHDPQVLYLDEPTIGLDLVAKTNIREFLAHLNREAGVTILLTTHDLADIERLCKRIIVIDHGHIVHDGDLARLRDKIATERTMTVDFDDPPTLDDQLETRGMRLLDQTGQRVRVAFERSRLTAPDVLTALTEYGSIRDMSIEEPSIESIIQHIYKA
ncbi:MAG: ATP-binding cassette domain-containing protein [Thermomicrobiales bacterium]|nr:ATP-binding cassette domain-containing protein [Thermomicrobiales bacterium]